MKLPDYLPERELAVPVKYEWSRRTANRFQGAPGEDHPKLWDAFEEISVRAAFALGVACSEWVVARLQHATDVSDALQRIEASWAATIDWRYASLPEPEDTEDDSAPEAVTEPIWLASLFLTDLHGFYVKTYRGVPNQGVRGNALRLALLARHVTPKKAGFDQWLTAAFRKAKQYYPSTDETVQKERPVPSDFFDVKSASSEDAVAAAQSRLLASLDPARNHYLRKRDQMQADGFKGDPYPKAGKR
jgi:hypothetical protein